MVGSIGCAFSLWRNLLPTVNARRRCEPLFRQAEPELLPSYERDHPGIPAARPIGEAGYFYAGGRLPLWRSVHFESEAAGGEIRELAREYMLAEGCRPAPVMRSTQSPGMPEMILPPEGTEVSEFMRGRTHFLISVREREEGGVAVSVDEFSW
jgi:hypothetical protein